MLQASDGVSMNERVAFDGIARAVDLIEQIRTKLCDVRDNPSSVNLLRLGFILTCLDEANRQTMEAK